MIDKILNLLKQRDATLLAYIEMDPDNAIVLVNLEHNTATPFVTWRYYDMSVSFEHGHYFQRAYEAYPDFLARASKSTT